MLLLGKLYKYSKWKEKCRKDGKSARIKALEEVSGVDHRLSAAWTHKMQIRVAEIFNRNKVLVLRNDVLGHCGKTKIIPNTVVVPKNIKYIACDNYISTIDCLTLSSSVQLLSLPLQVHTRGRLLAIITDTWMNWICPNSCQINVISINWDILMGERTKVLSLSHLGSPQSH